MQHYYIVHWNDIHHALAPFITGEDPGAVAVELEDRAGLPPCCLRWQSGARLGSIIFFDPDSEHVIAVALPHHFQARGTFC